MKGHLVTLGLLALAALTSSTTITSKAATNATAIAATPAQLAVVPTSPGQIGVNPIEVSRFSGGEFLDVYVSGVSRVVFSPGMSEELIT